MLNYLMVIRKNSVTDKVCSVIDLETDDLLTARTFARIEFKEVLWEYPCAVYEIEEEKAFNEREVEYDIE